jgi:hypothetical protein
MEVSKVTMQTEYHWFIPGPNGIVSPVVRARVVAGRPERRPIGSAATEHSNSHSVDVEVQADAGTVDSAAAQFERPTELSGYKE